MNAVDRAQEMFKERMFRLPYGAIMYAKFLCSKYGGCGETMITAFAGYAQKIEELPCDDDLYKLNEADWKEFLENLK